MFNINNLRSLDWYLLTDKEKNDIYIPIFKVLDVQSMTNEQTFGPVPDSVIWFQHPHAIFYEMGYHVRLYCTFNFESFPFDSHICDLRYGSSLSINYSIFSGKQGISYNGLTYKSTLKLNQSRLPFDIKVESLDPFVVDEMGFHYSFAGMRIHLKRNSLDLLLGGFFISSGIFALLSTISFKINPDKVPGRLGLLGNVKCTIINVMSGPALAVRPLHFLAIPIYTF